MYFFEAVQPVVRRGTEHPAGSTHGRDEIPVVEIDADDRRERPVVD
jgi:hypothetical protein